MSQPDTEPSPEWITEQSWSNPFDQGTFLHDLYADRIRSERDLIIIVDDYSGGRGTGKTVLSLLLAAGMDQTEEGLTREKVTMQAEEIRNAYSEQPPRSGLVLDEGEVGVSNRDAMTKTNKALREIMSMGRVEQKFVVVNTPLKDFLDSDILKLADVWLPMERKGKAKVHELKWEPHSKTLLKPFHGHFEFEDIEPGTPGRDLYNYLTRKKRSRIAGNDGDSYITKQEMRERVEKARTAAKREGRNKAIRQIMHHQEVKQTDLNQYMIADALDLSQPTISDILSDD